MIWSVCMMISEDQAAVWVMVQGWVVTQSGPFSWWGDQSAAQQCVIYYITSWSCEIGGRIAEEGLESLLHGTHSGISNPQPRPSKYFTERTLHTTHNSMADELNHSILAKFSGVTHTFAGYDKVIHETQERQIHYAEDVDEAYALKYTQNLIPNDLPKQNQHSKWNAQWCCVQPTAFPMPLQ